MKLLLLCLLLVFAKVSLAKSTEQSIVQFNETYELANIILALTEYGKSDKNEVNKNTLYYQEVLSYFSPVFDHQLLSKVNYSREKWDKLLSFRTDAVAFCFNKKGQLKRKYKFYSMDKEINEFEANIDLIQDFVIRSNFRKFYENKEAYFDSLSILYEQSLMIERVKTFLNDEFETKSKSNNRIIVSPLVGRMHCQRYFNKASTSFINIPGYLYGITSIQQINEEDLASGIHMFFTEIDHDYVNPTTAKFKKIYQQNFDETKWDSGSGYGEWERAIFNEYMTWAVYDIFVQNNFTEVADSAISKWHDVNSSRGFYASHLFGEKVHQLYLNKEEGETIHSLYPELLLWCKEIEDDLLEPMHQ